MKILIIDDESLDLFINQKLLSSDFEVVGFSSVNEGLPWIMANAFDVVLIDYYLSPGVFAHDALKRLQEIKGDTFMAFVLSNFVNGEQISNLKKAGFKDIILKPLTLEAFKAKVSIYA